MFLGDSYAGILYTDLIYYILSTLQRSSFEEHAAILVSELARIGQQIDDDL